MTENVYIAQVNKFLRSENDGAEILQKIHTLELPRNPSPLLALIHGDSSEYMWLIKFHSHDMFDDEIRELYQSLPAQIIKKLQKYVSDWDAGHRYTYSFSLKAEYNLYQDSRSRAGLLQDQNYFHKALPSLSTVEEAIQAMEEWRRELPKTYKFTQNQKFGHKRQRIVICFDIHTESSRGTKQLLLSGALHADNNYLVTSWHVNTH